MILCTIVLVLACWARPVRNDPSTFPLFHFNQTGLVDLGFNWTESCSSADDPASIGHADGLPVRQRYSKSDYPRTEVAICGSGYWQPW